MILYRDGRAPVSGGPTSHTGGRTREVKERGELITIKKENKNVILCYTYRRILTPS